MDSATIISIIAAAASIIASVISALVLRNQSLQDKRYEDMKQQVTRHEDSIQQIQKRLGDCKVDCTQRFVPTEQFVREAGFVRRSMDNFTATLNRIDGTLQVINKLPELCGQIASNIVKHFKDGG